VPGVIKSFSYSMAPFILADNPGMKPLKAITASKRMMKGYKWRFFCLQFSFIGWACLAVLSVGIGFLWLYPYVYVSMAEFYETLKRGQAGEAETGVSAA